MVHNSWFMVHISFAEKPLSWCRRGVIGVICEGLPGDCTGDSLYGWFWEVIIRWDRGTTEYWWAELRWDRYSLGIWWVILQSLVWRATITAFNCFLHYTQDLRRYRRRKREAGTDWLHDCAEDEYSRWWEMYDKKLPIGEWEFVKIWADWPFFSVNRHQVMNNRRGILRRLDTVKEKG